MASDSRTNAGHDQVNVARKMHVFAQPGERVFILLSSGSLSCTQSIITQLRRDFDEGKGLAQIVLYGAKGRALTGGDEVAPEFWDGRRDQWPSRRAEATSMDRTAAEIVAWLDGVGGDWNDARLPTPARRVDVDDVEFTEPTYQRPRGQAPN